MLEYFAQRRQQEFLAIQRESRLEIIRQARELSQVLLEAEDNE
jgi:hypothetical protein